MIRRHAVASVALLFSCAACGSGGSPGSSGAGSTHLMGGSGDASNGSGSSANGSGSSANGSGSSANGDYGAMGGEGDAGPAFAMDECGLDTGYEGDEMCILPPPPDKGFQIHVGPDDYDNPDAIYVLQPGEERTDQFPVTATNEEDVYFYRRQYRLRPTAHHIILTVGGPIGFGGSRIGTANASQDFPEGGKIAPENEGVGSPLDAHAEVTADFHTINTFDTPQLREAWINFWYRDPAEVTEPAEQIFAIGSATFAIQPHEDTMLGPFTCDVTGEGRMLWMYGHRHANNRRFSTWRIRDGKEELIYEGYDWEDPLLLEYDSLTENPTPNRELGVEGGWSGILDLKPGDQLKWECHVVNEHDSVLRFTNQTFLGEMCIVDAEMVGTNCY